MWANSVDPGRQSGDLRARRRPGVPRAARPQSHGGPQWRRSVHLDCLRRRRSAAQDRRRAFAGGFAQGRPAGVPIGRTDLDRYHSAGGVSRAFDPRRDRESRRERFAGRPTAASSLSSATAPITALSRCTISVAIAELSRSQRRSRCQSSVVARRQAGRLHTHDERQRTGAAGRGGRRAGDPWSIRLASVSDGTGRQVWKSDPGPGSVFRAVVAGDQLVWTGANRIVFPWERDGWTHLYSVPTEGGTATLLTPGEFEVEHVSYSADRSEIVYSSNQVLANDIDRRHIWRVTSAGGRPPPR